jgi:sRNA-binding protein
MSALTGCPCGKMGYASAAAAHRAHAAHQRRIKTSKRSKSRFQRETTQIAHQQLGVYKCAYGMYHRGHQS